MTSEKILDFYQRLKLPANLPHGVETLDPFKDQRVQSIMEQFYHRFFEDKERRIFLIGINPGRFGAGVTGIPFTDPIRLQEVCGIENDLDKKPELSSRFIYHMIAALGGPHDFYSKFFFSSVSPVGFISGGKNLNYYDIPALQNALETYMIDHMKEKIALFGDDRIAFSLGQGKNFQYLQKINQTHRLFREIKPLPHPRWVMQYRLKRLDEFIGVYQKELSLARP